MTGTVSTIILTIYNSCAQIATDKKQFSGPQMCFVNPQNACRRLVNAVLQRSTPQRLVRRAIYHSGALTPRLRKSLKKSGKPTSLRLGNISESPTMRFESGFGEPGSTQKRLRSGSRIRTLRPLDYESNALTSAPSREQVPWESNPPTKIWSPRRLFPWNMGTYYTPTLGVTHLAIFLICICPWWVLPSKVQL